MAGRWVDSMLRWGITIIVSLPLLCPWTWTCTCRRSTMNKFSSDLFFFSLHNVSAAGGGALCKVDTNTFPPTTVPAPDYHQSIIYQQHHHQHQRFMFVCLYFFPVARVVAICHCKDCCSSAFPVFVFLERDHHLALSLFVFVGVTLQGREHALSLFVCLCCTFILDERAALLSMALSNCTDNIGF